MVTEKFFLLIFCKFRFQKVLLTTVSWPHGLVLVKVVMLKLVKVGLRHSGWSLRSGKISDVRDLALRKQTQCPEEELERYLKRGWIGSYLGGCCEGFEVELSYLVRSSARIWCWELWLSWLGSWLAGWEGGSLLELRSWSDSDRRYCAGGQPSCEQELGKFWQQKNKQYWKFFIFLYLNPAF